MFLCVFIIFSSVPILNMLSAFLKNVVYSLSAWPGFILVCNASFQSAVNKVVSPLLVSHGSVDLVDPILFFQFLILEIFLFLV